MSKRVVIFMLTSTLVLAGGLLVARGFGLLNEQGGGQVEKPADVREALAMGDELDHPTFAPGELHRLIERKLKEGIEPAVHAYLRWTAHNYQRIVDLEGYTMTLVKDEVVGTKRWPTERMICKVRHKPFSVYVRHEEPKSLKGQEAIYVEGQNKNQIIGHTVGLVSLVGTLRLDPKGTRAMQGNRHPITELGLMHMIGEVVRNVPGDVKAADTDFLFRLDEEMLGRKCTVFEAKRRKKRGDDPFCYDVMWIDDENHLPIFYRLYEWGSKADEEPLLVEEYSHLDIEVNPGLTDSDFDPKNPAYHY